MKRMILSVSIIRNIPKLAIEIFTFLNGLSRQIIIELFQVKSPAPYYMRHENELYNRNGT